MIEIKNKGVCLPHIIGVDIGLSGGITRESFSHLMPTVSIETKPARYVLDLKDGKKQFYKTGSKKGQVKQKLKTSAKFKKELNVKEISEHFQKIFVFNDEPFTVVFEEPGNSIGNSAKATASTHRNYGKLLAIAELCGCKIVTVPANKWKKDLGLTNDKTQCVQFAEALSGSVFRTQRGALLDGQAESFLIAYWYQNYGEKVSLKQ